MMRVFLIALAGLLVSGDAFAQNTRNRGVRTPRNTRRAAPRRVAPSRSYTPRNTRPSRSRSYTPRSPSRGYTPRSTSRRYTPRNVRPSTRPSTRSRTYTRPTTRARNTRPTTRSTRSRNYTRPTTMAPSRNSRSRNTRTRSTYSGPNSGVRRPSTYSRTSTKTTNSVRSRDGATRAGSNGFTRRRGATSTADRTGAVRTQAARGTTRSGRASHAHTYRNTRYGYSGHTRHGHGAHSGHAHTGHSYYGNHGLHLSFSFGYGRYYGCNYYSPYYSYASRTHYAFFYAAPVAYCYAPYGFYYNTAPVYVTSREYVRDDYAETDYADAEVAPVESTEAQEGEEKNVEPEPAAGSPTTEKFLREGSEAFHKGEYETAAKKFRLAAIASPDSAGPLFALGQSLIALGADGYAARVIRKAVQLEPALVKEPGDIVGVYKSQTEFDAILAKLATRAEAGNADAQFLLAVQRYFTGDPRSRADFQALAKANAVDMVVASFVTAVEERFKAESELPPIK